MTSSPTSSPLTSQPTYYHQQHQPTCSLPISPSKAPSFPTFHPPINVSISCSLAFTLLARGHLFLDQVLFLLILHHLRRQRHNLLPMIKQRLLLSKGQSGALGLLGDCSPAEQECSLVIGIWFMRDGDEVYAIQYASHEVIYLL